MSMESLEHLMNRIRAFQESRALLTAVELDLFSAVGPGATAAEAASQLQTDERATEMLMNALTALGMLQKAFIAAMDRNVVERAPLVVKAVDTNEVRRMLDVGGGSGGYSIAFAKASPELHAEVRDLPAVLPLTEQYIEKSGLSERVKTRAGDLRRDEFGRDYDLVFVSAICHMLGPAENQDLFNRCFAALAFGGRIVVQDFILKSDKTAPRQAALFALNWLVVTQNGGNYSEDEYSAWLGKAGFRDVRHVLLPGSTGLMVGVKC